MPYYSYPEILANQNEILIELSCYLAHLVLIMSSTSTNMLANMNHMQYRLR